MSRPRKIPPMPGMTPLQGAGQMTANVGQTQGPAAETVLADPHRIYITGPRTLKPNELICPPALRYVYPYADNEGLAVPVKKPGPEEEGDRETEAEEEVRKIVVPHFRILLSSQRPE